MLWIFLAIHLVLSLGAERLCGLIHRRLRAGGRSGILGWFLAHGAGGGFLAGGLYLWITLFRHEPRMLFDIYFLPGIIPAYLTCVGFGLLLGLCAGGILGGLVGVGRIVWRLVRNR
jgi:hypothetical protein